MKKIVLLFLFALAFTSFAQNGLFNQTTQENLDKFAANKKMLHNVRYYFAKKLLGKDISKISYDELKKIYDQAHAEYAKTENKKVDAEGKNHYNYFFICLLFNEQFKKYYKEMLEKDSNNKFVKAYAPIFVPAEYFGNTKAYKKALVQSFQYISVKEVNRANIAFKKYMELSKNLKSEEILEDLKQIKRYVYPRLNVNEQWKQLATKIELNIRANQ